MKFINKGSEPEEFTEWKALANEDWQPNWGNFQKKEKPLVHKALVQEQGYICCYCGRRITIETSHIEHLKPRKIYPNLALEYTNILASCQKEKAPKEPQHCGVKKGDWYDKDLMVSPLKENCSEFFIYTDDGQTLPTNESTKQAAAATTIDKLGLSIDLLRNMRAKAIESILDVIDTLSSEEKQQLIEGLEKPNVGGQYEEFCTALIYILKSSFSRNTS